MATLSSILVWKVPWTEESGGLQSPGSQRDTSEATERTRTAAITHFVLTLKSILNISVTS